MSILILMNPVTCEDERVAVLDCVCGGVPVMTYSGFTASIRCENGCIGVTKNAIDAETKYDVAHRAVAEWNALRKMTGRG